MRFYNYIFLVIIALVQVSCGDFLGFSDPPEPELGIIKKVYLYLSQDSLEKLYNSVSDDDYAPCICESEDISIEAYVRVRGYTSLLNQKKSFTLKIDNSGDVLKYALDASGDSYIKNTVALYTYRAAGLPAAETENIALFINNIYQGHYTKIKMYNEKDLETHYNNSDSELFKGHFAIMGCDVPLYAHSEKKFPDDNDYTNLNNLIYYAKYLDDQAWETWVLQNTDYMELVKYMVVHDFLKIVDTHTNNFYIYFHLKAMLLPWDNERADMNLDYILGGNNLLTKRLFSITFMKNLYNDTMFSFFMNPADPEYILDDILEYANFICDEMDLAVKNEYNSFSSYENFIKEKEIVMQFLDPVTGRTSELTYPYLIP